MEPAPFKPQITPNFLVRSLHLKIPVLFKPDLPFTGVTGDSRKVRPGCLFVALKGEKFDGHDFIENAISKGARGILCRRGTPLVSQKDLCIFYVEDTLAAYRRLASAWRKEFSIPLVVIAGSVGKTTTKELLGAILLGKWKNILKTEGSQNGFIGIPMTILELNSVHEAAVIEVGIDTIGAMQQHMALLNANASVITAIGPEHLENLVDIPTVAREEGIALSTVAKAGGIVAINLDDPWIRPHLSTLKEGRKVPFSLENASASMDMISGSLSGDGRSLTFKGVGLIETTVQLPLFGKHNATNLLSAIAIAASLGLKSDEIVAGLAKFKGAEGRSEIRELPGKTFVICDYYNAQPVSMEAGLKLLLETSQRGEKESSRWACLADMLELGAKEEQFHREIAQTIINLKIENILLFGPRMAALQDELNKLKFSGLLKHFETHDLLAEELVQGIKPGDSVLIKGSRGMRMEEVWKILEPSAKARLKAIPHASKNPSFHA